MSMSHSLRPSDASLKQRLFGQSRWIPWLFVGLFGVVLAVNGIMVAIALDSWTGLVEHNYYRRGLQYNEALAAQRAQDALGWQVEVGEHNEAPGELVLRLSLADREGRAIAAERVVATLERPSQIALDRAVVFHAQRRGRYSAAVTELPPGVWDLRLVVHKGADSYEAVKRLMVQ